MGNSVVAGTSVMPRANGDEPLSSVYTVKNLHEDAEKAMNNISSLTCFKSTILARTAIFDSREDIIAYLAHVKRKFKWFDFDSTNLKKTVELFVRDQQGVHDVHLTGYLIICDHHNGRYFFRSCVAEFHEVLTYGQMAYKIAASSSTLLGSVGAGATLGAAIAVPFDVVTLGAASAAGAVVGAIGGGVGTIFINVNDESRRRAIEENLGRAVYDAREDRVNGPAAMEAVLVYHVIRCQRYEFAGQEVRIRDLIES